MICRDNFKILTDEEASQYEFGFCQGCALYDECELVEEYIRFRDNHPQIHNSQTPQASGDVLKVKATAVRIGGHEIAPLPSDISNASEMDKQSYDQMESERGCIMRRLHINMIACGNQRVAGGIGKHYQIETRKDYTYDIVTGTIDKWEPLQPVFISAPTGRGKTTFIETELIKHVRELNYKNNTSQRILILTNRQALQQQVKNHLRRTDVSGNEDSDPIPYKRFGDVAHVMNYQSLLKQEGDLKDWQANAQSRYIYVICDEAHFFTSDAMFNPDTSKILSAIVRLFQDAVRVYMSATPYECLEYIIKYEREHHSLLNFGRPQEKDKSIPMVFYHFKRDYGYLDVKAYSSISELYRIIVESVDKKNERWLIFIDDKKKELESKEGLLKCAKEYAKELSISQPLVDADITKKDSTSNAKRVLVVSADSKNNETYTSIVQNEELGKDTCVLITTSVLDNGINLTDINNIVVSDMSKVKCLQMLGRARVSGKDDRKTLYVKRFGGGEVDDRIKVFDRQKEAYHSYDQAYGEFYNRLQSRGEREKHFLEKYYNGIGRDWEDAKHWFGRSSDKPGELYFNEIARAMLERLVPLYQFIYDEMLEEGPLVDDETQRKEQKNHSGQKYLEYQLSWFGKVYCVDDDITFADKDKAKKAFVAFLESYAESEVQIDKEEQQRFKPAFTRLYDAAFGRADPNRGRVYSITKMNSLLEDAHINYMVASHSSYWIVQEHDWETEEE